ncbi:MAG: efflux RND transporter periplasmic adaptor subunit [Prevotella sp.]|nr:efflux RND transporter periplasmic adaptor subunit [Prevotella sp.]
MSKKSIWYLVILLASLLLAVGIAYSCWEEEKDDDEEESAAPYRTITISLQDYTINREFTTKIETEQPAEIRPQISGRLTKICVKEGAKVKKGQPLFIIDQTPYLAALRSAEARRNSTKAQLATARQNMEGKEELFRQHVIGEFDLNKARNELAEAEAALSEAKADLETAQDELSYTVIKSPSDGQISMIEYRIGELVGPTMEKVLTTVSDARRLQAYTAVAEKTLYDVLQYYRCTVEELPDKLPEVTLVTYWGEEMEQKGHIDAISGDVEMATGSVYIRASFDNPNGMFHNGSNGVLKVPYHLKDAIVIPQEATYDLQDRYFVYKVVDGIARSTEIKIFPYNDGQTYAVTGGLKSGDVIIAEGAGLLKEGMKVKVRDEQ